MATDVASRHRSPLLRDHPVLSGAFCGVHRLVRPFRDAGLRIVRTQVGEAGAEGDEDLFVVGEEEPFGEFALQADKRFLGVFEPGVGQQDDELFAAKARQRVLWAQRFADD